MCLYYQAFQLIHNCFDLYNVKTHYKEADFNLENHLDFCKTIKQVIKGNLKEETNNNELENKNENKKVNGNTNKDNKAKKEKNSTKSAKIGFFTNLTNIFSKYCNFLDKLGEN